MLLFTIRSESRRMRSSSRLSPADVVRAPEAAAVGHSSPRRLPSEGRAFATSRRSGETTAGRVRSPGRPWRVDRKRRRNQNLESASGMAPGRKAGPIGHRVMKGHCERNFFHLECWNPRNPLKSPKRGIAGDGVRSAWRVAAERKWRRKRLKVQSALANGARREGWTDREEARVRRDGKVAMSEKRPGSSGHDRIASMDAAAEHVTPRLWRVPWPKRVRAAIPARAPTAAPRQASSEPAAWSCRIRRTANATNDRGRGR